MYSLREWQRGGLHTWVQRYGFKMLWSPEMTARLHVLLASPVGCCLILSLLLRCMHSEGRMRSRYQIIQRCFPQKLPAVKPLVCLLHEKVILYLWTSVPYQWMSFFPLPCYCVCSLSVTAALAASGERRMRRMKSEKVNPNSPKEWAKRLNQDITTQRGWPWIQGEAAHGKSFSWGKVRPPEPKVCHHHGWNRSSRHHFKREEKEQPQAHRVLASLWRRINQIALCDVDSCPLGAGLWQVLISCRALICHQPGITFNHWWPGLHLDWQVGGGKHTTPLPWFKSLEPSCPPWALKFIKHVSIKTHRGLHSGRCMRSWGVCPSLDWLRKEISLTQ